MAHTNTWNAAAEASPAATDLQSEGDDQIRKLRLDVRERIAKDHYMDIAGTDADHGEHQKITFQSQIAKPAAVANKMFMYTKDVSSKVELFIEDEDGDEMQLTSGGVIIANSATTAVTATNLSGGSVSATTGVFSSRVQTANPLFSATVTATVKNCTGVSNIYTRYSMLAASTPACNWTEITDRATNFSGGTFTAPVTGNYLFTGYIDLSELTSNNTWMQLILITSNRYYYLLNFNSVNCSILGYAGYSFSVIADMDAADTAYLSIMVYDGTNAKSVDLTTSTHFQGYLLP